MAYEQQPFGFQIGYCSTTTAKLLVCSLYSDTFTVTCNGTTTTVTTTAIGTTGDLPTGITQAGYTGGVTLTGLSAGKDYPISVAHRSASLKGTIRTLPHNGDFSIIGITCDNWKTEVMNIGGSLHGAYPMIREQIESSPVRVCGLLMPGDDVYCDRMVIDDQSGTGHFTTLSPDDGGGEYARALAYLSKFGLFSTMSRQNMCGMDPDFIWCLRNMPWWIQVDDHTYTDNLGWWDGLQGEGTAASAHASFAEGNTVYDAFTGRLSPPSIGVLDTEARHWGFSIAGTVYICAPDRIHNANGYRDRDGEAPPNDSGVALGNDQIDDCLSAFSGTEPFKILASPGTMACQSPPPALAVTSGNTTSCQQPFFDDMNKEYRRLITAGTTGLQDFCNDNSYQFVVLAGDYHIPSVCLHELAVGGQTTESYIEVRMGSVRNSGRTLDPEGRGWVTGYANNSRTTLWRWGDSVNPTSIPRFVGHFTKLDFYTSRSPVEQHVSFYSMSGDRKWLGVWKHGVNGNLPVTGKVSTKASVPNI